MKVLLDIKDEKAKSLMDVLNSLPYVKSIAISEEKAILINEMKEAVENLLLVKAGKIKARPAKELLNEI